MTKNSENGLPASAISKQSLAQEATEKFNQELESSGYTVEVVEPSTRQLSSVSSQRESGSLKSSPKKGLAGTSTFANAHRNTSSYEHECGRSVHERARVSYPPRG